jgi:tryptophan halogenase
MTTVNKICIFGAGTAGWLTALALRTNLPEVKITLINPLNFKNIGVGESTQPNLINLLLKAKIDIFDFLERVDGTLKHGIYYRDWNEKGVDYWHAFSEVSNTRYHTRAHEYHKLNHLFPDKYPLKDYYKAVHDSYTLCVENGLSSTAIPYAYHVDANRVAEYVRTHMVNLMKVVDMEDYVIEHSDGKIDRIICNGDKVVEADLFIDCSGFNRVLIGKTNNLQFDGYEGNVNSALFGRIEDDDKSRFGYTRAWAADAGWIWTVPLRSRMGTGYAYNDKFSTEEDAKKYLLDFWKGRLKEENIRKLSFSSNSLKNPWNSNVVAIGLSAGFIEPLEATAISVIVNASEQLGVLLKDRFYDSDVLNSYNSAQVAMNKDIQDFIDVHYLLSARRDTAFWQYQSTREIPPRLKAKLELYRKYMPNKNNRNAGQPMAFGDVSWIDILTGYNFQFNTTKIQTNTNKDLYERLL